MRKERRRLSPYAQRNYQEVLAASPRNCPNCGILMWSYRWGDSGGELSQQATVDHLTPRATGGSNDLWNLCVICRKCNEAKGAAWDGKSRRSPRSGGL